ncbi:LysR family transcriptional regulator [Umezawaea tangerina]|uniref:LysR family transcriptional regulator n=1 Tax=Umezawaea tangerina TaxID=84725 RepID=A0A2T0T1N7_9PSEU|nr:LysR family transcriptional regulator [Umezawaea tangerina]
MDLNLLVAFDMLMTERSVTRAARRLSIGQSSMSATLARLRKLFDDPILVRDGRGSVPTPLAESLATPVHDLLTSVEAVLEPQDSFDPATAVRSFSVIANDYLTMTFLQPFIAGLATAAPGIHLTVQPMGDDAVDRLRRHQADLLVIPREELQEHASFPHRTLFHDRYVVAADRNHPEIGDRITLEQFSTLPYLAASSGRRRSLADKQLDFLGIPRNVGITTGLGVAPFLIRDTRLIALVHERLARLIADAAGIRLLDPPIPDLHPITEIMVWTPRTESDAGHRWLRDALTTLAETDPVGGRTCPSGEGSAS